MSRKVRVLQLIDRLGDGGAEALLLTFASGIDRARFEAHVCALRATPDSTLTDKIRALGVPVMVLRQRNSYDIPTLLSLVSYIRKHRIDIIHTHLLAADIMGRIAGFLTRRPVISTIHNSREDLDEEPRHRQLLERWTARFLARRLIVVSNLLHQEIADWFRFPLSRVISIPNGVDTERFRPGPMFDKESVKRALVGSDGVGGPIVINVARLTQQKALDQLIEAARIVISARPDVRFVLIGDGPLRDDLIALAEDLGVADKIIFTGFRTDIADLLATSDIFALSSLWEGMPIALLEAMAAGCAVVSTDVGGVAEVVTHEVTGLLVPAADSQALAAAILEYITKPETARQLGAAGQASVVEHYSMRSWVRKLEELYMRELGIRG